MNVRWATFAERGSDVERVGLVLGESLHALGRGTTLLELLGDDGEQLAAAGERAAHAPEAVYASSDVRLLPPVARPPTIRDFLTFRQHVEAMTLAWDEPFPEEFDRFPAFYFSNPRAVIGANEPVPVPPGCSAFDFELEVAVVAGRDGFNLSPEAAEGHIAGLCILNDWSARDLQRDEMRLAMGPVKSKDSAITLGPVLVTRDELDHACSAGRYDLEMVVSLNGREVGRDTLSSVHWTFPELLAYASRGTWISAGDVFGSGTCGNGCIAEHRLRRGEQAARWLEIGDEVTMEVERLGRISNRVVEGPPLIPLR